MFVPGKPFQPSIVFAGDAGAYSSETNAKVTNANSFRRGWTVFMTLTPGANVIKLFLVPNLQIFVISQSVCP